MHDAHCHLDQDKQPELFAKKLEKEKVFTIAVTNLPSHYALALPHLKDFRFVKPALGLHPLLSDNHAAEMAAFERLSRVADFIGEIGLDFSREGFPSKEQQLEKFHCALKCLQGRKRVISLHSRQAEFEVLSELQYFGIKSALFHWFTGSERACKAILNDGHFFSVNLAMLDSEKGRSVIRLLPKERVLTESDFPHVRVNRSTVGPLELTRVENGLAAIWKADLVEVTQILNRNLETVLRTAGLELPKI
jgi:TatD DNase family protein